MITEEVLRWCVISKYELEKCKQMNRSLSTNKEYSKKLQIDCVQGKKNYVLAIHVFIKLCL